MITQDAIHITNERLTATEKKSRTNRRRNFFTLIPGEPIHFVPKPGKGFPQVVYRTDPRGGGHFDAWEELERLQVNLRGFIATIL